MATPLLNITADVDQYMNRMPYGGYPADASAAMCDGMYYTHNAYGSPVMMRQYEPVGPVYGPSTMSPYQQFVDVNSPSGYTDVSAYSYASPYAQPAMQMPMETAEPCPCVYCQQAAVSMHHQQQQHHHMVHLPVDPSTVQVRVEPKVPSPVPADTTPQESPLKVESTPTARTRSANNSTSVPPPSTTSSNMAKEQPHGSSAKRSGAKNSNTTPSRSAAPNSTVTYTVEVRGHHDRVSRIVSHIPLNMGAYVVYEGDRGIDMGIVRSVSESGSRSAEKEKRLPMVVRNATDDEIQAWAVDLVHEAEEAVQCCNEAVTTMGLPLVICQASFQMDRNKLTFFYESDHRVDFRRLLMDMFNRYRCRIWMERM